MSLKNSAAAARYAHYARVTIMEPGLDASDDNSQAQGLIDLDLEDPPTTTRALFHFVCHQINSGYPVFWDEVAFSIGLLSESCDQVHQFYDQEMALLKEGERLIVEGKARRSLTRKMYKSIGRRDDFPLKNHKFYARKEMLEILSLNQDDLISAHALARVDTETFLTRRGRVVVKTMLCEHGVGVAKEYMDLDADSEDGKTWCMYKWEYTHGLERKKVDKYFL